MTWNVDTIPHPVDQKGQPIYTSWVEDNALGLTDWLVGSGQEGMYTHHPELLRAALDLIDWHRVALVKEQFEMKMLSAGVMVFVDHEVTFVTERRYCRLLRHAMKSISEELFNKEVAIAHKIGHRGTHSGRI